MVQQSLFSRENTQPDPAIAGLTIIPDYITPVQEAALLEIIDAQPWLDDLKRRVQHYGWKYDYKARAVDVSMRLGALPEWLQNYATRLLQDELFPKEPDQVIINEYQPGQGIAPHIDCVPCFEETIASLSLGSTTVMEFTHSDTGKKIPVLLEPRSLVVLSGEARYRWQHGIPHRKTDHYNGMIFPRGRRISLTFRNVIAT